MKSSFLLAAIPLCIYARTTRSRSTRSTPAKRESDNVRNWLNDCENLEFEADATYNSISDSFGSIYVDNEKVYVSLVDDEDERKRDNFVKETEFVIVVRRKDYSVVKPKEYWDVVDMQLEFDKIRIYQIKRDMCEFPKVGSKPRLSNRPKYAAGDSRRKDIDFDDNESVDDD